MHTQKLQVRQGRLSAEEQKAATNERKGALEEVKGSEENIGKSATHTRKPNEGSILPADENVSLGTSTCHNY